MRPNKYTERRKEARRVHDLLYPNDRRYYYVQVDIEPIWKGDFYIDWQPNPKHTSHPDFPVALGLRRFLPKIIVSHKTWVYKGKRMKNIEFTPEMLTPEYVRLRIHDSHVTITQAEYDELEVWERKFFSKYTWGYVPYPWVDREKSLLKDIKGRQIYRLTMDIQFFFVPVLKKYKETKGVIRDDLKKGYRILKDRYYKGGLGLCIWNKHHSDRHNRITPVNRRVENRQLQDQISEGLAEYYEKGD